MTVRQFMRGMVKFVTVLLIFTFLLFTVVSAMVGYLSMRFIRGTEIPLDGVTLPLSELPLMPTDPALLETDPPPMESPFHAEWPE